MDVSFVVVCRPAVTGRGQVHNKVDIDIDSPVPYHLLPVTYKAEEENRGSKQRRDKNNCRTLKCNRQTPFFKKKKKIYSMGSKQTG